MALLLIFSFLAGIVTVLSPCILPVLPIVLSSSFGKGKLRPLGIVSGFVLSFTLFTLFLTGIVRVLGVPADFLRTLSIIIIFCFGLSLLFTGFQVFLEKMFSYLAQFVPRGENKHGFGGGLLIGLSIGLLWTPCVGPILASVISLALTGSVTFEAFLITLSYSLGTAIPMFMIIYGGQSVLNKVPGLSKNSTKIQKVFGVLMMITAFGIYFDYDRKFQTYILEKFPNYGAGLIKLEENKAVSDQLENLNSETDNSDMGKPSYELTDEVGLAPELISGGKWFNLPAGKQAFTLGELRGKVVLIDFWTYTCINCIRTLPYLRTWDEKYSDRGFVIIGVHTPEFEFEKDSDNVQKAIADFGLKYPVMQDNSYATWRAYNNRYWPAKYMIDKDGRIRYTHFGEGDYDETEKVIQKLLEETGTDTSDMQIDNEDYQISARTPELYLGYQRMEYLASPERVVRNNYEEYTKPTVLPDNNFAFEEKWLVGSEYSAPVAGSKFYLNFESKEVFLVMRPKDGTPGKLKVHLNKTMTNNVYWGEDALGGEVLVNTDRLYKIIKLENPERLELLLEFLDNNVEVYAFTFG